MKKHVALKRIFCCSIFAIFSTQSQIVFAIADETVAFIDCTANRYGDYDITKRNNNTEFVIKVGCSESADIPTAGKIKPREIKVSRDNAKILNVYSKNYKSSPTVKNRVILQMFIDQISIFTPRK